MAAPMGRRLFLSKLQSFFKIRLTCNFPTIKTFVTFRKNTVLGKACLFDYVRPSLLPVKSQNVPFCVTKCERPELRLGYATLGNRMTQNIGLFKTGHRFYSSNPDNPNDDSDRKHGHRQVKLMDFPGSEYVNPFKLIRNMFFSFLIKGYFDPTFSQAGFIEGAQQVNFSCNLKLSSFLIFFVIANLIADSSNFN